MATQWQTYPVEFRGGLLSNMSLLQQGVNAVGSASVLQNFEVNKEGGYSKVRGFEKFSDTEIPGTGDVLGLKVVSSGRYIAARKVDAAAVTEMQTATADVNGAVSASTAVSLDRLVTYTGVSGATSGSGTGATFNVFKDDDTYTNVLLTSASETGYAVNDTITILGTDLGGSTPANDLTITVTAVGATGDIQARTFSGTGKGFGTIEVGMYVTGTGITGTVTVATVTNQDNIVLSSSQTIADNTTLTFGYLDSADVGNTAYYYSTGSNWNFTAVSGAANGGRVRHAEYNFDGDDKVIFVDGTNYPSIYNTSGNVHTFLDSSSAKINTDVEGADFVTIFKRTAFFAKDNLLLFTAPFTVDNFSVADGAGSISLAHKITGLAVFRDQLIVFTTDTISRLTGSSQANFRLDPVTEKIGCINGDTIQEVGGDIMYLAPDGIRQLSATDRIGDFALDVASDKIKEDFNDFLGGSNVFASTILREKAQYRIFKFKSNERSSVAKGLTATKKTPQGSSGIEWSTLKGFKVHVIDSVYTGTQEAIGFANSDGYAYTMESSSTLDGDNIEAIFQTAYMPIGDPQVRKTMYKSVFYIDPTGSIDLDLNVLFDFESSSRNNVIQPNKIDIQSTAGGVSFFGGGLAFGATAGATVGTFGSTLEKIYPVNIIGSGNTVSLKIADSTTNPTYTLDTAVLEYKTNDRQ